MNSFGMIACITLLAGASAMAQQTPPATITGDEAIDRATRVASLTRGAVPFHAILEIDGPAPAYAAKVDLLWAGPSRFRLTIASPGFQQLRIADGDRTYEKNDGDYYPRWLQNFVDALLDPLPEANFRGSHGMVALGDSIRSSCLRRDDRPGGITDQLTWGDICFSGPLPLPESVLTFNRNLSFSDYKAFGKQIIARTYTTDVLDYKAVTGRLVTLDRVKDIAQEQLAIPVATPESQMLRTGLVSTLKEEGLIDHAPAIEWPTVREGKTEGYMIVYARTDRTGQVRETAKHNSDNPGLEQFGMEQALHYKFHPLLIDGVPQQMEMPLVLHFKSKIADPLPMLSDGEIRRQIGGCTLPVVAPGQASRRIILSVNEQGKLTGESFPDANNPSVPQPTHFYSFRECLFKPYLVNGKPSYYHGELLLPR